jgi:hypothetical protein
MDYSVVWTLAKWWGQVHSYSLWFSLLSDIGKIPQHEESADLCSRDIAMSDEKAPVADEMSRSSDAGGGVSMPDHSDKPDDMGSTILLVLAIFVIDTIGVLMPQAGPYSQTVAMLGLGGFACGATLGAYVSVKIKRKHWWSSCRWAIYGLLGACLTVFIAVQVVLRWR